ncbi:MAG: DUF1967 domain-containing protein, partial [Actinobacteria bacterium]|nr:DUF1967 domain-containing protein [Actinomycetota bacterium]
LGLKFLRHVERCSVLAHVIDCATLEPGRDPVTDLDVIEAELAAYQGTYADLLTRPRVVVLNKVDVPEAKELADMVRPQLEQRGYRVFEVSAVSHEGLRPLLFALAELVSQARAEVPTERPRVRVQPQAVDDSGFSVSSEVIDGEPSFRILGARPERWVRQTDFSNDEAVGYLADRLARLGVEDRLKKLGATPGVQVVIGEGAEAVIFDWQPQLSDDDYHSGPRGTDNRL